jgi:glycosyltransferase involved in cell wall biosynthesis
MKVSIATVTYNHADYLAQSVESALGQKTDFPFEIVIGEDCSTDGTREVARSLAARYPDRIRLLLPENNLGLARNTVQTIEACRGEYVAILEGDDFWIDPEKLQKQVDFLDANRDCAWCFTRARIVDADGKHVPAPSNVRVAKPKYTLAEYLERCFQPRFCTVMFRHHRFEKFPEWVYDMPTVDLPLHILNTHPDAMIGFVDAETLAYRIHPGGVWSQGITPDALNRDSPELQRRLARRAEQSITLLEAVDRHLAGAHRRIIRQQIAGLAREWTQMNLALNDRRALLKSVRIECRAQFSQGCFPSRHSLLALARVLLRDRSSDAAIPKPLVKTR